METEMAKEDQDDVRYYDRHGVEHRLDSKDLHLIDGGCRQSPIVKGILVASAAIVIFGIAIVIGGVLGYIAIQLRNVF
jgi:hypothetical protein